MTKPPLDMASADVLNDANSSATASDPQLQTSHLLSEDSPSFNPAQPPLPPLSSRPETAPKQVAEKLLKGKEVVGKALAERSGQLTLLELPVDILRLVVHEVRNLETQVVSTTPVPVSILPASLLGYPPQALSLLGPLFAPRLPNRGKPLFVNC